MKKKLAIVVTIFTVLILISSCSNHTEIKSVQIQAASNTGVISYGQHPDGRQITLEYDLAKKELCMRMSAPIPYDKDINFLANEVKKIETSKTVKLGNNYTLQVVDGPLSWTSKYRLGGSEYNCIYLTFTGNFEIKEKDLYIHGQKEKTTETKN